MTGSVSLSFRVSAEKAAALDKLANATERPRSWLLEKALESYLETQAWQVAHVEQGAADFRAGRYYDHDVMKEWLLSWGTDNELEPPDESLMVVNRKSRSAADTLVHRRAKSARRK